MRRFLISRLLWMGLIATPIRATAEPTQATIAAGESLTAAARTHYARGLAFYERRDYAVALAEFQRAYSLVPNPKLHFSMGQAYAGLGRYAAAFDELETYVDSVGTSVPDDRRLKIERQLEAFRARVGQVAVTVNVAGATIAVDGEEVGTSPLHRPLLLDARWHRIGATRPDYSSESAHVGVVAGDLTPVSLLLQPSDRAARSALEAPLWIATGLCGALGLGSGVLALVQRRNYEQSLEQAHEGEPGAIQHDLDRQRSRLQAWLLATDILLGVTAATGVAAIYLSVRESGISQNAASASTTSVSATLSGQF